MEDPSIKERIRQQAYLLWLNDGAMEGCSDEYWHQAREIVEKEVANERMSAPVSETKRNY